jgi:hypothetical protein
MCRLVWRVFLARCRDPCDPWVLEVGFGCDRIPHANMLTLFGPYNSVNRQSKVEGATRKTTWVRLYSRGDDGNEGNCWWGDW